MPPSDGDFPAKGLTLWNYSRRPDDGYVRDAVDPPLGGGGGLPEGVWITHSLPFWRRDALTAGLALGSLVGGVVVLMTWVRLQHAVGLLAGALLFLATGGVFWWGVARSYGRGTHGVCTLRPPAGMTDGPFVAMLERALVAAGYAPARAESMDRRRPALLTWVGEGKPAVSHIPEGRGGPSRIVMDWDPNTDQASFLLTKGQILALWGGEGIAHGRATFGDRPLKTAAIATSDAGLQTRD